MNKMKEAETAYREGNYKLALDHYTETLMFLLYNMDRSIRNSIVQKVQFMRHKCYSRLRNDGSD